MFSREIYRFVTHQENNAFDNFSKVNDAEVRMELIYSIKAMFFYRGVTKLLLLYLPNRKRKKKLRRRETFYCLRLVNYCLSYRNVLLKAEWIH